MKKIKLLSVMALLTIGTSLYGQYTLTDNDVEVFENTIISCSYNFTSSNIIVPDSLDGQLIRKIGTDVFRNKGIVQIAITDSVTEIGENAFTDNLLQSIELPTSLHKIGAGAFAYNQLTSLTVHGNVESIGDFAFEGNQIGTLTLEEGIVSIGSLAFSANSLTNLSLPSSISNLGDAAFQSNNIESFELGSGITELRHRVFWDNNLAEVTIPEGVTIVGDEAFADNQITTLTLPSTITYMAPAFNGNQISSVNGEPSDGIIYGRHEDGSVNETFIASYGGAADVIDFIPDNVTLIGYGAFQRCGITSVTLLSSVTTIDANAFMENNISELNLNEGLTHIAEMVFYDNALESLDLPSTVRFLGGAFVNKNNISTFNGEPTNGIIYALNGEGATDSTKVISYAGSLTEIPAGLFPQNLTTIGGWAFHSAGLNKVTLPETIENIENNAFDANYLDTIVIPQNVTKIGAGAFVNNSLNQIVLPSGLEVIESYAFAENQLEQINLPQNVHSIGEGAFAGNQLTSLTIPASISQIGSMAFQDNQLSNLYIPGNVEQIGRSAFTNNQLATLTLEDGVKIIEKEAFMINQLDQDDLNLPTSVSHIGSNAFNENLSIDSIYLHTPNVSGFSRWINGYGIEESPDKWVTNLNTSYIADVTETLDINTVEIIDGVIMNVNLDIRVNKVTIPRTIDNQVVIGIREHCDEEGNCPGGVFENHLLKAVTFPSSLESIGSNAFYQNTLTEISLPDSLRYIGHSAFSQNPEIDAITLPNPDNEDFIEWTDQNNTVYPGGTTVYNLENAYFAQYRYTLQDDDVVMENGVIKSCSYDFQAKHIIIPDTLDNQPVVVIDEIWVDDEYGGYMEGVFQGKGIKSIQLPETLDTIGEYAFAWNEIQEINLPEGLHYINYMAFYTNLLSSVEIPQSVTHIGAEAFGWNILDELVLPQGPENMAYWYDNEFNKYEGGSTVTNLQESYTAMFQHTLTDDEVVVEEGKIMECTYDFEAKYVIIPETLDGQTVTKIGELELENEDGPYIEGLFAGKGLREVELPATLDSIGMHAFGWNQLSFVHIPENVSYIDEWAFAGNGLDSLTIADETQFGLNPFMSNELTVKNGELFDGVFYKANDDGSIDSTTIACYGSNDSLIDFIGDQVKHIEPHGFFGAYSLYEIVLPDGLKTVGHGAFGDNQLSNITLPSTVVHIGPGAFGGSQITSFALPDPQTEDFLYWYNLYEPDVHYEGGEVVSDLGTGYTALIKYTLTDEDVEVQNGVITASNYDYRSAYIVIPETLDGQIVRSIGEIEEENEDGPYIVGVFQSMDEKQLLGVELPATLDTIGINAFAWNRIETIELPAGLHEIEEYAFQGNALNEVAISDSVTYIGEEAFADQPLASFVLPSPQNEDFLYWFDGNYPPNIYNGGDVVDDLWTSYTALIKYTLTDEDVEVQNGVIVASDYDYRSAYIVIPETLDGQIVRSIGEIEEENEDGPYIVGMFQSMDGKQLLGVELPSSLDTIGINAFAWNSIGTIDLPAGVRVIEGYAFQGNTLNEVTVPDSVTHIGEGAFAEQPLTSIELPSLQNEDFLYWFDGNYPPNIYNGGDVVDDLWTSYTALIKYTLTDDDVVMENGVIVASDYDYRSAYIVIPETLDGQIVRSIGEIEEENEDGPYIVGIFQGMDDNYLIGVELPETLDSIGFNAFGWNQISEIELPVGLKFINSSAFAGNQLRSITLHDSLRYIGDFAFDENTDEFTGIVLPNNPLSDIWVDNYGNEYSSGETVTDFTVFYSLFTGNGIQNYSVNHLVTVYPNPASAWLHIEQTSRKQCLDIRIYDMMGKIVLERTQWKGSSLNVSNLKKGAYILSITKPDCRKAYRQQLLIK